MSDYELYHVGVKGMKWGVRKARPKIGMPRAFGRRSNYSSGTRSGSASRSVNSSPNNDQQRQAKVAKAKKAVKVGAAVAGTVLAAYGAYKIHDLVRKTNTKARINQAMRSVDIILGNDITGTRYSTEQKSKMIRDGLEAGRSFAKNDSFGTALKNATRYEILRRTKRL